MLEAVLPRIVELVRHKHQGGWDPYRRFFEIWAALAEAGSPLEQTLLALSEDFAGQPLGEVASDFLKGVGEGRKLEELAAEHPEYFSTQAQHLLHCGSKRNMAKALRGVINLL